MNGAIYIDDNKIVEYPSDEYFEIRVQVVENKISINGRDTSIMIARNISTLEFFNRQGGVEVILDRLIFYTRGKVTMPCDVKAFETLLRFPTSFKMPSKIQGSLMLLITIHRTYVPNTKNL